MSKTLKEKLKIELHDVLKEVNKKIRHLGNLRIKEEHESHGSDVFVDLVEKIPVMKMVKERAIADIEIEKKLVKMYAPGSYDLVYKEALEPVYAFLRKFIQENGFEEKNYEGRLFQFIKE